MRFYIYDDSGDTYKMLLDYNTTPTVAWANHDDYIEAGGTEEDWSNSKMNKKGPVTATKQLNIDTSGWIGSPRLITAYEVATIVGFLLLMDNIYHIFHLMPLILKNIIVQHIIQSVHMHGYIITHTIV